MNNNPSFITLTINEVQKFQIITLFISSLVSAIMLYNKSTCSFLLLQPKPILDTITEEEKYGNRMEHNIGKKVVKAVEGVSNLVNSAFRVSSLICLQITVQPDIFRTIAIL